MSQENWDSFSSKLHSMMISISFTIEDREIGASTGFDLWRKWTEELRKNSNTLFLVGNGASASMASHFLADMTMNGHIRTKSLLDISLVTAVANDVDYESVFSFTLGLQASFGDMLVAISGSGRSPNIIKAVKTAKDLRMKVVTVSAMTPDNPLRALGDLNVYVNAETYGEAESCHACILHHWMDLTNSH